ncbi:PQQ-binding-like beta-propeller repeat protein [Streptomyces sp. 21So2-11]|uniref:outer membrane protein assembly factor BamB family protein n=1 Tax=Streptomyces sp. 21So2-11 TaxID=3144408 RepID=UPI00321982C0
MRHKHSAVFAAACLLLTAGCSTPEDDKALAPQSSATSSPTPKRVSYDPPHTFSRTNAISLPKDANTATSTLSGGDTSTVALHKTLAYVAGPVSLTAIDTSTGETLRTIRPAHPVLGADREFQFENNVPAQPVISGGDAPLVAQAFLTQVPASGTTPARRLVEVVTMNADTAKPSDAIELELPKWAQEEVMEPEAAVVDSEGALVVVTVRTVKYEDHAVSFAIDLARSTVVWKKGVLATGLSGRSVVAIDRPANSEEQKVLALDLADGATRWTADRASYETHATAAGPHLIYASGRDYKDGERFAHLLDARTGKKRTTFKGAYAGASCAYDAKSVVVCSSALLEKSATGFDAETGKLLWRLPDEDANRVAPEVTALWHGLLYGTTDAGPVLLDARTGQDVEGSPAIAPLVVNGYTGIAEDAELGGLAAYRAAS